MHYLNYFELLSDKKNTTRPQSGTVIIQLMIELDASNN